MTGALDVREGPPAALAEPPSEERGRWLRFRFTGTGAEYFRIWIINLALSLLTLGVYSAWAKVRTQQYFYRHTWVEGSSFEYLGDPRQILKGRLLITLALGAAFAMQVFFSLTTLLVLLLVVLATPWVVVRSTQFRARNSAYRNVRFGFVSTLREAYGVYFQGYIGMVLTCGLFYPTARWQRTEMVVQGTRYGSATMLWRTTSESYYGSYVKALGLALPAAALLIWGARLGVTSRGLRQVSSYALLLLPTVFLRAAVDNLLFGGIVMGPHHLSSRQRLGPLLLIYATNALAVLGTLGLAIPWAKVRLARYRIECLTLHARGGLEVATDARAAGQGGYGDAALDLGGFDLGIG